MDTPLFIHQALHFCLCRCFTTSTMCIRLRLVVVVAFVVVASVVVDFVVTVVFLEKARSILMAVEPLMLIVVVLVLGIVLLRSM